MARPRTVSYQDVADAKDRVTQRGEKPTQEAVARELGKSRRTVQTYWPPNSPEILTVTIGLEGAAPAPVVEKLVDEHDKQLRRTRVQPSVVDSITKAITGVVDVVLTETTATNPATGEPFADGRTLKTEIERQGVESHRAGGMTIEETAEALDLDEERVKYLRKKPPPA